MQINTIQLQIYNYKNLQYRPKAICRSGWSISFFSARCNIYISRLCYDVSVCLSVSYIVAAADLQPRCIGNAIIKFADDTYLIIPAANFHTREVEVLHVESWAAKNNLHLNCAKSHEIVFRSRRLRGKDDQPAPPCCGIERVEKLTILGIIVNSSLTATDLVSYLLDSCSSLLHALRVLRSHGLPSLSLKDVFHATVIGKLIYCAPAWHGFCLASDYTFELVPASRRQTRIL